MAGSAVITTSASSATMKYATDVSASAQPGRARRRDWSAASRSSKDSTRLIPAPPERGRVAAPVGHLVTARLTLTLPMPRRPRNRQLLGTLWSTFRVVRGLAAGPLGGPLGHPALQLVAERGVLRGLDGADRKSTRLNS